MYKSFISYSNENDDKRAILSRLLRVNKLNPIIVALRNKPSMLLAAKVEQAIEEADFLIPILTKESIQNQWVNQEIGYSNKLVNENKLRIIPIVEESIMDCLKGFVHKQMDLPFKFKANSEKQIENNNFKLQCSKLTSYLKKLSPPRKNEINFNSTFSYLSHSYSGRMYLESTLVIENTGNKVITISSIQFSFLVSYSVFKRSKGIKVLPKIIKVEYQSDHFIKNHRKVSLIQEPVIIKPREVKKLQSLVFCPIRSVPYDHEKRVILNILSEIEAMNEVNSTFVFLSGERIVKSTKILH